MKRSRLKRVRIAAAFLLLVVSGHAAAQSLYRGSGGLTGEPKAAIPPPSVLQNVEIEQRIGSQLPLNLRFRDESGREVRLGDFFGSRPVVLSLVYYECPMLCGEVLNGMSSAFGVLKFDIGKEYEVVTVSFDPREQPELAAAKKGRFVQRYGRPGGDKGWHFLTGSPESINALSRAVGFNYEWDERTEQYAHAAAIMVVTPDGRLAQYLYGVEYAPKDLRLALVEASQNKLGSVVDKLLLYCYHYDPRTGKYGAIVSRVLQIAGLVTVLIVGAGLIVMFKLEPKHARQHAGRPSHVGTKPGGRV